MQYGLNADDLLVYISEDQRYLGIANPMLREKLVLKLKERVEPVIQSLIDEDDNWD